MEAETQPQAMSPGPGLLPGRRDTFLQFLQKQCVCWQDSYTTEGLWVMVRFQTKPTAAAERDLETFSQDTSDLPAQAPFLPSSSDPSYSKSMEQNLWSDGGHPCLLLTVRS